MSDKRKPTAPMIGIDLGTTNSCVAVFENGQPLVIHNLFGDEGLNDAGISVSKTFSNPWNIYLEATGEAFKGDVENVFQRRSLNDLFYNAHLKAFRDISENSNIEVGTSYSRGALANASSVLAPELGAVTVAE